MYREIVQDVTGIQLFAVQMMSEDQCKKKKAKLNQASQETLSLTAGADDDESDQAVTTAVAGQVSKEIQVEIRRLLNLSEEHKRGSRNKVHECRFCPYRSFSERRKYLNHLQKYHVEKRVFTALDSNVQWNVVNALFEQRQVHVQCSSQPK